MKKILPAFLFVLLCVSCQSVKLAKLLKKGSVSHRCYEAIIPFEYRVGVAVIQVTIHGKKYDFLVDTGAPNVISKALAKELGLETVATQITYDSQGAGTALDFVLIDTITLGGLDFLNTGAAVADLEQSHGIACMGIDGFIGANLMKEAIWQFDYGQQEITLVPDKSQLEIPTNAVVVPFKQAASGTPQVLISYNGINDECVTFDTGANDAFSSTTSCYRNIQKETGDELRTTYGFGKNASGLYGNGPSDTTYYASVDVQIGPLAVPEQIVNFKTSQAKTIGTRFLKHYTVIVDWFEHEITFIPKETISTAELKGFGFSINRSEDELLVGFLYHGSEAESKGLQIGDRIVALNGKDYSALSDEDWCEIVQDGPASESVKKLWVTIIRNEEKLHFELERTIVLK